jgi:hypothetical protein
MGQLAVRPKLRDALAEAVATLSDPFFSAVATAVAGQAAELAVQGGKEACAALVRLVRDHLGRDKTASSALDAARGTPGDAAATARLATELQRIAAEDDAFAARLRALWPQAAAELSTDVVNTATGTVGGHLMQARDVRVEGDLRFGDVHRPGEG